METAVSAQYQTSGTGLALEKEKIFYLNILNFFIRFSNCKKALRSHTNHHFIAQICRAKLNQNQFLEFAKINADFG